MFSPCLKSHWELYYYNVIVLKLSQNKFLKHVLAQNSRIIFHLYIFFKYLAKATIRPCICRRFLSRLKFPLHTLWAIKDTFQPSFYVRKLIHRLLPMTLRAPKIFWQGRASPPWRIMPGKSGFLRKSCRGTAEKKRFWESWGDVISDPTYWIETRPSLLTPLRLSQHSTWFSSAKPVSSDDIARTSIMMLQQPNEMCLCLKTG